MPCERSFCYFNSLLDVNANNSQRLTLRSTLAVLGREKDLHRTGNAPARLVATAAGLGDAKGRPEIRLVHAEFPADFQRISSASALEKMGNFIIVAPSRSVQAGAATLQPERLCLLR
jgi:hypothetical protein